MDIIKKINKIIKENNIKDFFEIGYGCCNPKDIEKILHHKEFIIYYDKLMCLCKKNPAVEKIRQKISEKYENIK